MYRTRSWDPAEGSHPSGFLSDLPPGARFARKEGDRIIERATDKVMSRHLGATSSYFVEKEKKSIAKLVAAYVEAAGRARRR